MRKYLLPLLFICLTCPSFAAEVDRSSLYTIRETMETVIPRVYDDGKWGHKECFDSADCYITSSRREVHELDSNCRCCRYINGNPQWSEELCIYSRHLFGNNGLTIGDLTSIYLNTGTPLFTNETVQLQWKDSPEVDIVDVLDDGVILRLSRTPYLEFAGSGEEGDRRDFSAIQLARLVITDHAYHIVEYVRLLSKADTGWTSEEEKQWLACLKEAKPKEIK